MFRKANRVNLIYIYKNSARKWTRKKGEKSIGIVLSLFEFKRKK